MSNINIKDALDNDIYYIQMLGNVKHIHIDGFFYTNDTHGELMQYTFAMMPLAEFIEKIKGEEFSVDDFLSEHKAFIYDFYAGGQLECTGDPIFPSEDEWAEIHQKMQESLDSYSDEESELTPLPYSSLTEDTPCGVYINMEKIKMTFLFGSEAVTNMGTHSILEAKRKVEQYGGDIKTFEFNTYEEYNEFAEKLEQDGSNCDVDYIRIFDQSALKNEITESYNKFSNNVSTPSVANVEIMWKDDGNTMSANISLYDCTPDGYDDDDIFYYCSGLEDLISLCDNEGCEDFVVIGINGFE